MAPRSKHLLSQAPFVSVGVYMNGHWQIDSLHREIGGGTWNRRPALPWTLWRIRNNEAIEGRWRVAEIKAYRRGFSDVDHLELRSNSFL